VSLPLGDAAHDRAVGVALESRRIFEWPSKDTSALRTTRPTGRCRLSSRRLLGLGQPGFRSRESLVTAAPGFRSIVSGYVFGRMSVGDEKRDARMSQVYGEIG
jgi:hypothetical protein